MKKRTLQQAKDLLILWHIVRIAFLETDELNICICGTVLDLYRDKVFTFAERDCIKADMFNQSLEYFSPRFRSYVKFGRKNNASSFCFYNKQSRLKFINARIERLKAEILKLQSNE